MSTIVGAIQGQAGLTIRCCVRRVAVSVRGRIVFPPPGIRAGRSVLPVRRRRQAGGPLQPAAEPLLRGKAELSADHLEGLRPVAVQECCHSLQSQRVLPAPVGGARLGADDALEGGRTHATRSCDGCEPHSGVLPKKAPCSFEERWCVIHRNPSFLRRDREPTPSQHAALPQSTPPAHRITPISCDFEILCATSHGRSDVRASQQTSDRFGVALTSLATCFELSRTAFVSTLSSAGVNREALPLDAQAARALTTTTGSQRRQEYDAPAKKSELAIDRGRTLDCRCVGSTAGDNGRRGRVLRPMHLCAAVLHECGVRPRGWHRHMRRRGMHGRVSRLRSRCMGVQ